MKMASVFYVQNDNSFFHQTAGGLIRCLSMDTENENDRLNKSFTETFS